MNNVMLPEECAKQWEILLLLIASEEKKINRTNDNEIDTMSYFLKNEGVKHILLQWIRQMHTTYGKKVNNCDTARKSDDISLIWRQRGNENFRANLVNDSYKCYTKSVVYANQNGPMYSLALANRSAALLRLKRFQEALADIALALDESYPKDLCHKLMLRRADCYIEMSQRDKAIEAMAAASQHAASIKLSPVQIADFDRHVKILERKMEVVAIKEVITADVLPDCYKGEGDTFTAASSVLELRRSDTVGRYVVTREATHRGDVLFSEEPYAWVPLPCELPLCDGCCAAHINLIPCTVCSRSAYCNVECRTRASVYHKYECNGAQADIFPTIGIAHLALRVLLVSTIDGFPELPAGTPLPKKASDLFAGYANVDNVEIYHKETHPFYRMFNLVTNFEKMNNMDYIQYALTSTMLILYLEHFTSFFEHLPGRIPYALGVAQLRLFAGALMLRALGQLVCNGHAALTLAVVDDGDGPTVSEREVRRATAIYPSAAMMNHSCDPTIINTLQKLNSSDPVMHYNIAFINHSTKFYKARLIVRGACDLPAGGQVLNCYGPHRARDTTSRRQQLLRAQYLFTCSCAACLDIQHRDTVLLFSAYACQQCKGPVLRGKRACAQCHTPFNLQRVADVIEEAEALQVQADCTTNLAKRIEKGLAALRLKQRVWYRHHVSLRIAADELARQLADHGDFNKSVELIKQNIQSLEYQFGSFSVEVAHELRKLSEVMLERILKTSQNPGYRDWCLETHKVIKKAVQLMDLNYGSWEPLVKKLKEQETLVATLLADSKSPVTSNNVHHMMHYNLKI